MSKSRELETTRQDCLQVEKEITKYYVDYGWYENELGKHQSCCTHCQNGFEFMVHQDQNQKHIVRYDI